MTEAGGVRVWALRSEQDGKSRLLRVSAHEDGLLITILSYFLPLLSPSLPSKFPTGPAMPPCAW